MVTQPMVGDEVSVFTSESEISGCQVVASSFGNRSDVVAATIVDDDDELVISQEQMSD